MNGRRRDATQWDRLVDERGARASTRGVLDRPTACGAFDDPRGDGVTSVGQRARVSDSSSTHSSTALGRHTATRDATGESTRDATGGESTRSVSRRDVVWGDARCARR